MEKASLKGYAYREIKHKIVNCVFAPGAYLNENQLAGELNISRTPIREALSHLQEEGLVRIIPKKGILVSTISIADVSQIYQVRLEIEPFIVRLAGPNLDSKDLLQYRETFIGETEETDVIRRLDTDISFHRYLAVGGNNKYLLQLMNKLLDENRRITIIAKSEARLEHSHEEHIQLIDSLLTRDFEASALVMRRHIENCRDSTFFHLLHTTNAASTDGADIIGATPSD